MVERGEGGKLKKGSVLNPNGRPKKEREIQYREVMVSVVTLDRWKKIIAKAADQAERGDSVARKWLADYLIGTPVQKSEVTGAEGGVLEILVRYADRTDTTEAA